VEADLGVNINRQTDPYRRGVIGAFKQGILDPLQHKGGYIDPSKPKTPIPGEFDVQFVKDLDSNKVATESETFIPLTGPIRSQYGDDFYKMNISAAGYDPVEALSYRLGGIGSNIWNNVIRHKYWDSHPADKGNRLGIQHVLGDPLEGFPKAEAYQYKKTGHVVQMPGTPEAATMGALGGFLGVEALFAGSGNYNPLNIAEGGRAAGYAALSADENGDQRKPTSVPGDIFERHVLGRKGRILPWEQFREERPDVSYENYERYRQWQFGRGSDDPLNDATFGVARFTPHGLDGKTPELNVMGVSITPLGAAAALGTVMGARQAHKYLGRRAFDEYADLTAKAAQPGYQWTPQEAGKMVGEKAHNPFARTANLSQIRAAQYANDIKNKTGRYAHHVDPLDPNKQF
jgi:hypothetical protein